MITGKLPSDAFAMYTAMGPERSYQAIADHFKVSKRTVTRTAVREDWMGRLSEIEKKTREMTDAKLVSDLHEMQLRHRKLLRAVGARAAKAISDFPLESGMEGIKAAEIAIKLERLLAGEHNEHSHVSIETTTKRELERFIAPAPGSIEDDGETDDDEAT
jgi:hypothetical protein